jgi:septum formation protein
MAATVRTLKPIVLATASASRRALLKGAGVAFEALASDVDEAAIKAASRQAGKTVAETALALARAKAAAVQALRPGALVIGADQMLDLDGAWFDKPADMAMARQQLAALRGKTHSLHAALCLFGPDGEIWSDVPAAQLTMRAFSDAFLVDYLDDVGETALKSVGGYFLEGLGVQLFERIDGDYFTILGLPMTELLKALRAAGALPA